MELGWGTAEVNIASPLTLANAQKNFLFSLIEPGVFLVFSSWANIIK